MEARLPDSYMTDPEDDTIIFTYYLDQDDEFQLDVYDESVQAPWWCWPLITSGLILVVCAIVVAAVLGLRYE